MTARQSPGSFQDLQRRFAAHLRNPAANPPPPGIEARRMRVYAELFGRSIEGILAGSFPVLRRVLPEAHWQAMVRDFYARHVSTRPQFYRIAEEFLEYLADERGQVAGDPPYLVELAHYEWVELALGMSPEEIDSRAADPNGDLLDGVPVLSPLAWALVYEWPVHRISTSFRPDTPPEQPVCLVAWRDRQDETRFMELNPVTARLLELMETEPGPGRSLLERIAAELGHPDPRRVVQEGGRMLANLRDREIIPGTRP